MKILGKDLVSRTKLSPYVHVKKNSHSLVHYIFIKLNLLISWLRDVRESFLMGRMSCWRVGWMSLVLDAIMSEICFYCLAKL